MELDDLQQYSAETIAVIQTDRVRGAGALARLGTMLLRDIAESTIDPPDATFRLFRATCHDLALARQSMAPIAHIATYIFQKSKRGRTHRGRLQAAAKAAREMLQTSDRAPALIAHTLRPRIGQDARILTLSASATVGQVLTLLSDTIAYVTVLTSEPGGEGLAFAQDCARNKGWKVYVVPDSAVALAAREATYCLAGADALLADGTAVNKVGTYPLALAAAATGIPMILLSETTKIAPTSWQWQNEAFMAPTKRAEHPQQATPVFERIPLALATVLTDCGIMGAPSIASLANTLDRDYQELLAHG